LSLLLLLLLLLVLVSLVLWFVSLAIQLALRHRYVLARCVRFVLAVRSGAMPTNVPGHDGPVEIADAFQSVCRICRPFHHQHRMPASPPVADATVRSTPWLADLPIESWSGRSFAAAPPPLLFARLSMARVQCWLHGAVRPRYGSLGRPNQSQDSKPERATATMNTQTHPVRVSALDIGVCPNPKLQCIDPTKAQTHTTTNAYVSRYHRKSVANRLAHSYQRERHDAIGSIRYDAKDAPRMYRCTRQCASLDF
jgi:hypothetical protein